MLNLTEYVPSIILEARTPNVDQIEYGQRLKGYFYAPNSGTYRFFAKHDDGVSLFVSKVKGSAEIQGTADLISTSFTE